MGQTASKVNLNARRAVTQLYDEIAAKRSRITEELEELRRRKNGLVSRGRRVGALLGFGAITVLCVGSILNAVVDIFAAAEETEIEHPVTGTMSQLARDTLRIMALAIIRRQLSKWHSRRSQSTSA